ncbi:cytochrome P450 [Armillaria borealis]|uniref:Cytochrome P450 n=1 Tax=Armillaria borealis TaxID=47425 RepID=A0AA39MU84_9AGAR|nr:cytochrome P450 [Armillaria borealis]
MTLLVVALAFIGFLLFVRWLKQNKYRYPAPFPPGPTPIPLFGNLCDFTSSEPWLTVTQWAKKYGDVCYLHVVGQGIVFLSSADAASDLLDKRGAIYSDRPELKMVGDLCGCNRLLPFLKYDSERFTRQQRFVKKTLGPRSIPAYHPMIRTSTNAFLSELINSPSHYLKHARKYAGGLTLSVVYGYQACNADDRFLKQAEVCLEIIANDITAGSGIWPVDLIPLLEYLPSWMPGASFKKKAALWNTMLKEFAEDPFEEAKTAAKNGTILPSFCSNLLSRDESLTATDEEEVKYCANSMFAASADTVYGDYYFSISPCYDAPPGSVKKAQAEIDRVVGYDRLPELSDKLRLAILVMNAVMSEVWRWGVPVPLNIPHCLKKDDEYRGMHLPKGSIVIANIWTILRDEKLYPRPDVFDPERFMNEGQDPVNDPRNYIFGFGRRRCPGADLVESSIWLLLASMIASLDIKKLGKDPVKIKYSNSFFRVPDRLACDIKPRSEKIKTLLEVSQV